MNERQPEDCIIILDDVLKEVRGSREMHQALQQCLMRLDQVVKEWRAGRNVDAALTDDKPGATK